MKKLPSEFKQYFWDIDFAKLNPAKHPKYVLERLLDYGDEKALAWMDKNFPVQQIIETVKKSRALTHKSANFWTQIYNLSPKEVLCLNKHYQTQQEKIWAC